MKFGADCVIDITGTAADLIFVCAMDILLRCPGPRRSCRNLTGYWAVWLLQR